MKSAGLTLIELLIVIAILAILIMMAMTTLPKQLEKARDAERKSDLQKIKIAYEHYYNDNGCYPSADVLENCGGTSPADHELSPYMQYIPCDPLDSTHYYYLPYDSSGGSGACDGFRVWASLEKDTDPAIETLGCDGVNGCGVDPYNYGVSSGVPVTTEDPSPTPTPPLETGYCCVSVCNVWDSEQPVCGDGPYVDYNSCVAESVCTQ